MKPIRSTFSVAAAVLVLLAMGVPAHAGPALQASPVVEMGHSQHISPGVSYRAFRAATDAGPVKGHLLRVDLWHPKVEVGLLYPGAVAATDEISAMADAGGAVAGVNGDFFNIGQTGAPVGPAIADGQALKAAVPDRQRHGPDMPPGYSNDDGFGITADGRAVLTDLRIDGEVRTGDHRFPLDGLNQYAITVNGVAAFDSNWGSATRVRSTCGTDDDRNAPCSRQTREVHITDGEVTQVSDTPGSGPIPQDTIVLVARDEGTADLDGLSEGDRVEVEYGLREESGARIDTAVGGFPIVADGTPLTGVDDVALAPRTAAGASDSGMVMYLVAVEGRGTVSVGASLATLADIMVAFDAAIAVNLDGGGSTTLVTRGPGETAVAVRNVLSGGTERPVPNGLGIFKA